MKICILHYNIIPSIQALHVVAIASYIQTYNCIATSYTVYSGIIVHIVHGGKLLQLWCLVKICSKTFVVVSFVQHLIDYLYEKFAGKLVVAIVNP